MTAITLLHLALSLLIAAQQPNVPESLKTQAIQVANAAIMATMEQTPNQPQKASDYSIPTNQEEPSEAAKIETSPYEVDTEKVNKWAQNTPIWPH